MDEMLDDIYGEDAILDTAMASKDSGAGYEQLYESIAKRDLRPNGALEEEVSEAQELSAKLETKTAECERLKGELAEMKQQVKKLTRMKETLAVNISSLYKTAVTEVGRKDQQIKELNQKVRALT